MNILRKSNGHVFRQINPGIWQITFHFPLTVNCWLYEDAVGLTLVDSANPWNTSTILEAVELLEKPLKRIIVTHAHPDHAGAAASISSKTGADVFVHEDDLLYLRGNDCLSKAPGRFICRRVLQAGRRFGILNPTPVPNAIGVKNNESIGNLQVIHTPGHTPGSISLWSESASAMFVGDNVSNSLNLLRINDSVFTLDTKMLQESLQRYAEFSVQMILPGHGPAHVGQSCIDKIWGFKKRTPPINSQRPSIYR